MPPLPAPSPAPSRSPPPAMSPGTPLGTPPGTPPIATPAAMASRACEICHQGNDLFRCASCQAVYYCGRDHQAADRASHKKPCSATRKARVQLRREEQRLHEMPGGWDNIFEYGMGHFWGLMETRPYMRARFQLVDKLLQNFGLAGGRVGVVETCLDHLLDMIRLCRSDNMGVRDLIPALYIRMGRDQEAYDFAKWYATTGEESDYDWGDIDQPFLDLEDADVLEPPTYWSTEWLSLSHAVAVVLIKIRVLLNLQAIQNASRALHKALPQEIIQLIRVELVTSVLRSHSDVLMGGVDEVARLIEVIKKQIKELHRAIKKYNPDFWPSLLVDSTTALNSRPQHYSPGSLEEAYLVIGYNYAAWSETPGAMEVMRAVDQTT